MDSKELEKIDHTFSTEEFIIKAKNRIKRVLNAITLQELETVKHFMSESLYQEIVTMLNKEKEKGLRRIYDEVNVFCEIDDIKETEEDYVITVRCHCKYLLYYLSEKGELVRGNQDRRIESIKKAIFQKKKGSSLNEVIRCEGCGVTLNINETGKCDNCGRIYDLKKYDFIITELE